MASYARDIYFGVRVEDRATRPLRRIARDFQALGRQGLIQRQRVAAQAQIAARNATLARKSAQAELQSLQSGSRAFQLEKQRAALGTSNLMTQYKRLGVDKEAEALTKRELRNAAQLALYARNRGFPKGSTPEIKSMYTRAALAEQREIMIAQDALAQKTGIVSGALTQQVLEEKRLIAVEGERIAQEARLEGVILSRAEAERIANERLLEANQAVRNFPTDRLRAVATYLRHTGAVLATVGAIGVFAFASMGKSAADFATQVTVAATQTTTAGKNTVAQVQKNASFLQAQIQKMLSQGQVIATPAEQTSATYKIFSGTTLPGNQKQQLKEGIGLLREFNQVTTANAGLVKLDEVVSAGLTILNRFRVPLKALPHELNTMQAAVRFGNLNLSQFIGALNQAAPAAQGAGYNFTQMSASIAFLSRQFPSLRLGVTGYARLLEVFAKKETITGLKQHGIEITHVVNGVQKLLPIETIAQRIIDRFGGSVKNGSIFLQNFFKEMGNTQGTIQARRVLISYVQNLDQAKQVLKDVTGDHDELQKSLEAAQKSPGVRWQEFVNQLKGLALEIGQGVLPAISMLADKVRGLASWFNNLSPGTKRAIGYFGAMASVAALLLGILFTMGGAIFGLALSLGAFSASAAGAEAGVAGLAAETGAIAPELAIVIAGFAALGFLTYKYPNQMKRVAAATIAAAGQLRYLWTDIRLVTEGLIIFVSWLIRATRWLITLASKPWNVVVSIITKIPGSHTLGGWIKSGFDKVFNVAKYVSPEIWAYKAGKAAVNAFNKGAAASVTSPTENVLASGKNYLAGAQESVRKAQKASDVKAVAASVGVAATQSFRKLYDNYVKQLSIYKQLKAQHASALKLYQQEGKVQAAATALQSNVDKQKSAAAMKAANDFVNQTRTGKKFSDQTIISEARRVQQLERTAKNEKTFAAWKAYYKALDKLQSDATSSQLQAVQQIFDTTASKAKSSVNKIAQMYQQVLSNLKNVYQTFYTQNENLLGQLFQGPYVNSAVVQDRLQFGQKLGPGDLIKDARSQVKRFDDIQAKAAKLRKRGVPEDLIQQVLTLPPDQAQQMLTTISKMSKSQVAEYGRIWKAGQKAVHDQTLKDVNTQLKDWRKHGRQIALAIAAGLRDENTTLEKSLREIITKAFPSLASQNKGTPPKSHPGKQHSTGTSGPSKTEHHVHYHVTAPKSAEPTIKQQVAAANWHHRTRQK